MRAFVFPLIVLAVLATGCASVPDALTARVTRLKCSDRVHTIVRGTRIVSGNFARCDGPLTDPITGKRGFSGATRG